MNSLLGRAAELLTEEGVRVEGKGEAAILTSFEIGGRVQQTIMLAPNDSVEYFVIFSEISNPIGGSLDKLPIEALREIIRIGSTVMLARFECLRLPDGNDLFAAVSECSVSEPSGKKLRRRLEACADLAVKIEDYLKSLS